MYCWNVVFVHGAWCYCMCCAWACAYTHHACVHVLLYCCACACCMCICISKSFVPSTHMCNHTYGKGIIKQQTTLLVPLFEHRRKQTCNRKTKEHWHVAKQKYWDCNVKGQKAPACYSQTKKNISMLLVHHHWASSMTHPGSCQKAAGMLSNPPACRHGHV